MLITLLSMLDSESDRREFAMLYERYHEEMELAAPRMEKRLTLTTPKKQ